MTSSFQEWNNLDYLRSSSSTIQNNRGQRKPHGQSEQEYEELEHQNQYPSPSSSLNCMNNFNNYNNSNNNNNNTLPTTNQCSGHINKNLANDVKLCTLLQSMSIHVQSRTVELSKSISNLESKLRQAEHDIDCVALLDSLQPDLHSMFFQTSAETDEYKYQCDDDFAIKNSSQTTFDNDENILTTKDSSSGISSNSRSSSSNSNGIENLNEEKSTNGLDKMQKEEDEAIKEGIKALSIFHDHTTTTTTTTTTPANNNNKYPSNNNNSNTTTTHQYPTIMEQDDENDNHEDDDDDDDEDSFYYYESSPHDLFNQRPLPFIVGSMEFLNSVDGGIGEEIACDEDENENDDFEEEVEHEEYHHDYQGYDGNDCNDCNDGSVHESVNESVQEEVIEKQ